MNCKPGDLAMVVRDFGDEDVRQMLGRTFRITTVAYTDPEVGAIWNLEEPQEFKGDTFQMCGDIVLMPIDRPLDDAPVEEAQDAGRQAQMNKTITTTITLDQADLDTAIIEYAVAHIVGARHRLCDQHSQVLKGAVVEMTEEGRPNPTGAVPRDGGMNGLLSGYEATYNSDGVQYTAHSEVGVRGFNVPCYVTVIDGVATVAF